MKAYKSFWDNFNIELYKKIVELKNNNKSILK